MPETLLTHLLENNRSWSNKVKQNDPTFFAQLAQQQSPEYLWIGCSDSRVPANQITGLKPGEVFVHRNIANLVVEDDLNCLSVLQYAVEVLKVKHIIVCGHYGCGGVQAALDNQPLGLIDQWLKNIKAIYQQNKQAIDSISNPEEKTDRLCELNVIEQVKNISRTPIVQNAWKSEQKLTVHGWIYDIHDGVLKDLGVAKNSLD